MTGLPDALDRWGKASLLPMLFLLIGGGMSSPAHSAPPDPDRHREPVTDARPLMRSAIDSVHGEAYGRLTGEFADAITRRFSARSPIFIDVTTLRRYTQAGCSRLEVTFWQEGVRLPGASEPRRQTLAFGINYCRDGLPPRTLE